MLAKINSYGIVGIHGYPVLVEVDVSNGLPVFDVVGLPDAAVKESRERVKSAIRNSGFSYPSVRVTVNLAPADIKKEGPIYDLPMAVGILCATGQVDPMTVTDYVIIGELSLNGDIRPVNGVLPMAIDARSKGYTKILLPKANCEEAAYIEGLSVYPVDTLRELVSFLNKRTEILPLEVQRWDIANTVEMVANDFSQIRGQHGAKRAMEIAAAGGHNILLIGPPGAGKTMIARSLSGILPNLHFEEVLEITKIHSVSGKLESSSGGLVRTRPFRAPHHTASSVALTGGGPRALPGEVSLAHCGVLFLDELPEFKRDVLEALRQPLEDGIVTISRATANMTYPANFMLVASMNPCPCGHYGTGECRCTPAQIQRYLNRISGPLLDRIDMHVEMAPVTYDKLTDGQQEETSAQVRDRVNRARQIQTERFAKEGIHCNAQMDNRLFTSHCVLDAAAKQLMERAFRDMGLSARAYGRVLKVARTIADLAGSEKVQALHIAEAIQYRSLDRKYWGKR